MFTYPRGGRRWFAWPRARARAAQPRDYNWFSSAKTSLQRVITHPSSKLANHSPMLPANLPTLPEKSRACRAACSSDLLIWNVNAWKRKWPNREYLGRLPSAMYAEDRTFVQQVELLKLLRRSTTPSRSLDDYTSSGNTHTNIDWTKIKCHIRFAL